MKVRYVIVCSTCCCSCHNITTSPTFASEILNDNTVETVSIECFLSFDKISWSSHFFGYSRMIDSSSQNFSKTTAPTPTTRCRGRGPRAVGASGNGNFRSRTTIRKKRKNPKRIKNDLYSQSKKNGSRPNVGQWRYLGSIQH